MTSHGEGIEEEQISRIEKGMGKDCHGGIETVICTSPSIVCLTQKVENNVFFFSCIVIMNKCFKKTDLLFLF